MQASIRAICQHISQALHPFKLVTAERSCLLLSPRYTETSLSAQANGKSADASLEHALYALRHQAKRFKGT